jgi:hypothetical protein
MLAIRTVGLCKRYGDTVALDGLDLTPFAHVGLVPAQPFRATPAVEMLAIAAASAIAATWIFQQRDLTGA